MLWTVRACIQIISAWQSAIKTKPIENWLIKNNNNGAECCLIQLMVLLNAFLMEYHTKIHIFLQYDLNHAAIMQLNQQRERDNWLSNKWLPRAILFSESDACSATIVVQLQNKLIIYCESHTALNIYTKNFHSEIAHKKWQVTRWIHWHSEVEKVFFVRCMRSISRYH